MTNMKKHFRKINRPKISSAKKIYSVVPIPILVIRLDCKGILTLVSYVDPSIDIIPQNIIGKSLRCFHLHLENFKKCTYHLKQVFATAKKEVFQLHIKTSCYTIFFLPEQISKHAVESVLAIVCDTTKKHPLFAPFSFYKDKLEIIQQIANIGYYEWDLVTNRFFWTDQVYRNIGLVPQSITPSLELILHSTYQEDLGLVRTRLMQVPTEEISDFAYRAVKPDGSIVWLHTRTYSIINQNGNLLKKIGTVQDITSEKMLEIELKKLTARLNHINNSLIASQYNLKMSQKIAKLGYFEWDITNKNIFWSDQQYENFGYSPQEFVPTVAFFRRHIYPDDVKIVKAAACKISKEKYSEVEFRILKANGSVGWVYVRVNAITDQQDCLIKLLGITQDITVKKQTEDQIKRAEKELFFINQLNNRSNYLNRLLVSDYPLEYTSKALSEFGIESQVVYCCFVIQVTDKPANETGMTLYADDPSAIKQQVLIWLSDTGYDKIWSLNNNIILLVPVTDNDIMDNQGQLDFALQLAPKIKKQFPSLCTIIGISGSSSIPLNIKDVYEKAYRAAIVATIDSPSPIIHFDDIGLYKIAFQLIKDKNIVTLANSTIGRIVEYDQTRGGNLLLTLKYILEDESLKVVAQKLYIHPNTAIWRKHRIEELLRMSLDKMETKVTLMLHLKMWELQHNSDSK